MKAKHEWRPGVDFAEFAEALGINTDQIMAASAAGESRAVTVLYTATTDEHGFDPDEPIYGAGLVRDSDGILRVFGRPFITKMNYEGLRRAIEEKMAEVERDDA